MRLSQTAVKTPYSAATNYATNHYQVGGSLPWNSPVYIPRQASKDLITAIQAGQMCTVLGPRQTGKSSLRVHTRHQLEAQGYYCATLYATQLLDSPQDYYRWDKQLTSALWDSIHPENTAPLRQWLTQTARLLPQQRLEHFSRDLLFNTLNEKPVVIFIDDAEALLDTPFLANDLFDWIWHCHCLRKFYPIYRRLNFVVLGNALPNTLIKNQLLLNNSQAITLKNFDLDQTQPLQIGFQNRLKDPSQILEAILRWTNGHPLLTQKLCALTQSLMDEAGNVQKPVNPFPESLNQWVDYIAETYIINRWNQQAQLSYLRDTWNQINQSKHRKALLHLYQNILKNSQTSPLQTSHLQASPPNTGALSPPRQLHHHPALLTSHSLQEELLLSGWVIVEQGQLRSASQIHRQFFSALM